MAGVSKKITLRSLDGEDFEIDEKAAMQSQTILHMIEDQCSWSTIPLSNVKSNILAKVIEYCNKHVDSYSRIDKDEMDKWDFDFTKSFDLETLFQLILAANYLNINGLLNLTCGRVAEIIKGKDEEEIRKTFKIKTDLTAEEEDEIRREYDWALQ